VVGARNSSLAFTCGRRSIAQLGTGAFLGIPITAWLLTQLGRQTAGSGPIHAAVAGIGIGLPVVLAVPGLSCPIPTRQALQIEPSETWRTDV
jgi:hypothetical protein